jgi:hypothetical protein
MAIEYIWLFLEESTTDRRERGRSCTQTVHNEPTTIFTTYFSKVVMAPSDGMAVDAVKLNLPVLNLFDLL